MVLAGNAPFYAPGDSRPCVWYRVVVEEERTREVHSTDANGNRRSHTEHYWVEVARDERMADFYLQDGPFKVFVNGSNRGTVRIQGTVDAGGNSNIFSAPPPGIQWLISQSGNAWGGWLGKYRYSQESFDVNEMVAGLGHVVPAMDPFSGTPCKFLMPLSKDALSQQYVPYEFV